MSLRPILLIVHFVLFGSPACADSESVEMEISGATFTVSSAYVVSRKAGRGNSPEHLWVAFSVPSHEALGVLKGPNNNLTIDVDKRTELRARGEEIIEMMLIPDRGQLKTI